MEASVDLALVGTVPAWISAGVLAWGAVWAYSRFKRERVDAPQIEFTVDANFFSMSDGDRAVEFILVFHNKGKTRVQVSKIELWARGIKAGEEIRYWEKRPPSLLFPHKVIQADNIIPSRFEYIFFEPGVRQEFRFVSIVPSQFDLLLIHGEFNYVGNGDPHYRRESRACSRRQHRVVKTRKGRTSARSFLITL
jgi:hypothetical protein